MLTLHSYRRCPFAMRARMVLEEKGLSYKCIDEDLADLSPELLSMHPEGRVPLLIHDLNGKREVIYQSTVITEYLDEAFPQKQLMPKTPELRAQARLWTYWCDQIFKPDLDLFKYDQKKLSAEELAGLEERLHAHLTKWNSAFESSPYLLGSEMTLADIHLFPFARQFLAIKPALNGAEKYAKLTKWLESMVSRPAFAQVMAVKNSS